MGGEGGGENGFVSPLNKLSIRSRAFWGLSFVVAF
jgi:hypothetical protein